jgi:hypothetical protein
MSSPEELTDRALAIAPIFLEAARRLEKDI